MENILQEIYKTRKDFSEKDQELIAKVYSFAEKAHEGQMKGKKSFFILFSSICLSFLQ
jgi:(p)ppGpp synthase/HD superfamily hydrolase